MFALKALSIAVLIFGYSALNANNSNPKFKPHEIWHSGYYPVVWTNKNYKMLYLNMGHNDIDYEHKYDTTNKPLSYTLNNTIQDRLIIDGLLWLALAVVVGRQK